MEIEDVFDARIAVSGSDFSSRPRSSRFKAECSLMA